MSNKTLSIGLLVAAPLLFAAATSQAGEGHAHNGEASHANGSSHAGHENEAPETQSFYKDDGSKKADATNHDTAEHSHEDEDGGHSH